MFYILFCALITLGSCQTVCYSPQDNCISYFGCVRKSIYKCCSECEPGYYVSECECAWGPLEKFLQMGSWCVQGWDLGYYDVGVEQCAYMCDLLSDCVGFEYFAQTNISVGRDFEQFNACRPKSGGLLNASECVGNFSNMDFYFYFPEGFLHVGNTLCGGGDSFVTHPHTYNVTLSTNVVVTWDRTINGCANLCDTMGTDTCVTF